MSLSLNPPKGTADWIPEEFRLRKYIFDTRRTTCESFGYQEYLGPLVEDASIWEAKSGEDVGGTELTKITDREGKVSNLALRPEMTPTVTRMVSKYRRDYSKPIRRFSIANFYRNERPQRGRNREFRQLNVDIFGSESHMAEVEVLQMSVELMKKFGATSEMYEVRVNHRGLVDAFLDEVVGLSTSIKQEAVRTMDKRDKLTEEVFITTLKDKGCSDIQATDIMKFMQTETIGSLLSEFEGLVTSKGTEELRKIFSLRAETGVEEHLCFTPSLMRGFDYYDGVVFEVFDMHKDNNRALFGGGRYNGLAEIFGVKDPIPAIGFAPGDETMKLFLESHNLVQEGMKKIDRYFIPILENSENRLVQETAQKLRAEGKKVEVGFDLVKKMGKMYEMCEKKGITHVVLVKEEGVEVKELR